MKKTKSIKIIENKEEKENDKSLNENKIQQEETHNDMTEPKTVKDFLKDKKKPILFKEFPGFFFKKFNLTTYKKERSDSRERSKSPEYKYKPSHKKGNGVPDDLFKRLKYITKITNSKEFMKYYHNRPKGKEAKFEDIVNYIIEYSKNHNEVDSVLMAFYFICNDVKYYSKEALNNLKEKYKNKSEYSIFLDKKFFEEGYNPKPKEVYMKGIALKPEYLTNIFEFFLKKMEIKFKHIEGYCKLMEVKDTDKKNLKQKLKQKHMNNYLNQRSKSTSALKGIQSLPENTKNHIWNAVYMKGEWYFVDIFFGSGGFIKENPMPQITKSTKKINENLNYFYFMCLPEYFISTHRPVEDLWQFLKKTITFEQFFYRRMINFGEFYNGVMHSGVELLTHKYPLIETVKDEKLQIKLRLNDYVLEGDLYNPNFLNKVGETKNIYDDETKIYTFEPTFPNGGEFILRITSRPIVTSDLIYKKLIDYKIKVKISDSYLYFDKYKLVKKGENNKTKDKNNETSNSNNLFLPKLNNSSNLKYQIRIINDYDKILPSKTNKIICYDNQNFHLIEPRTKILRKGIKFKFKIKIKKASNVNLLDGNQWMPLKKTEEDIYEGIKEIETDNVSICCLRNKNVFTEVIKFMIYKDRSILSKNFFPKIKRIKKNLTKINIKKG